MKRFVDSGWGHGISLVSSVALMGIATLLPRVLTTADGHLVNHGVLMLIMWGMSAGFVHGVDFNPDNRLLRTLLGAYVAWPLQMFCWVLFLRNFLY